MKRKRAFMLLTTIALLGAFSLSAAAAAYPAYTYSFKYGSASPCPAPYNAQSILSGTDMNLTPLSNAQDLFFDQSTHRLFIADTGNSRVILYNTGTGQTEIITSFLDEQGEEQTLSQPQGVYCNQNGDIAIADTGNKRIVVLNREYQLLRILTKPQSEFISERVEFTPTKLIIDRSGRVFCISAGINEGMLEFSETGEFVGFSGANKVITNPIELLWKKLSSQEQNEGAIQFVPTEFSNLDVDASGFIYTTTATVDQYNPAKSFPVRKQNTAGTNVLIYPEGYYPIGDLEYPTDEGDIKGPSSFIDVSVRDNGMMYCLDSKRGRIFVYNSTGDLLYTFGGLGDVFGAFKQPVSLTYGGDRLYVLDAVANHVTVFNATMFGNLVETADLQQRRGEYDDAFHNWQTVLQLDSNYELAYMGIGRIQLQQGEYREAMNSFRLAQNRSYYSKAFEVYRAQAFAKNIGWFVSGIAVFLGMLFVWLHWGKKRASSKGRLSAGPFVKSIQFAFYCMTHPFDGFYDLKKEKRGSYKTAFLICALFWITLVIQRQATGFIFNPNIPEDINILLLLCGVAVVVFLWCITNWSITTLMSGEGTFGNIFMATSYALMPYIVIHIPLALVSRLMTESEAMIYQGISVISFIWTGFLLFAAMLSIHQYTAGKTILSILATALGMGIILFLCVLFFNLIQQLFSFGYNIYNEIIFRI